jgi:hypothetical protein
MLIAVQFPIADGRSFLPGGSSRLTVPDWPAPRTEINPQFVRHFGPAMRRRLGANPVWFDEHIFCSARRAIRFKELNARRLRSGDIVTSPSSAFRRLFSDGRAAARVEVGLRADLIGAPGRLPAANVLQLVQQALDLPTEVLDVAPPPKELPIVAQGPRLARLYGRATTARDRAASDQEARLVEAAAPVVVVETLSFEPPRDASVVDAEKVYGAQLAFVWLKTSFGLVGTWILGYGNASGRDLRLLRLALFRLHVEKEALDVILKQIRRGQLPYQPGDDRSDDLERYLNEMTRLLGRRERFEAPQAALVETIGAAEKVVYRDPEELLGRLEGARMQIRRKVERYERERTAIRTVNVYHVDEGGTLNMDQQNISGGTFYGPVTNKIVADRLEGSFNTITNAGVSDDLKEALTVLHQEVKELVGTMGQRQEGDPERLTSALETFAEQATKEKPLAEVVRAAGREIVDAGKAVAEHAAPVLGAVNAALGILGIAGLL